MLRQRRVVVGASGPPAHPQAKRLLVLWDGGGSNSATQYLFKEDLQGLANRLGLEIRVAHYPPYCSKYNPIEHRVFPHITRACQGVIFHTVEIARQFIERTKTTTGLRVTVRILDKVYETGRKYAAGFKETMKILFDDTCPSGTPDLRQPGRPGDLADFGNLRQIERVIGRLARRDCRRQRQPSGSSTQMAIFTWGRSGR